MTSPAEVALAVEAGADAIGAIVSPSPRRVVASSLSAILAAVPPYVTTVAVSTGETDVDLGELAARGVLLQFSGHETAATCERFAAGRRYVKAFHVRAEDARPVIAREALDAYPNARPVPPSRTSRARSAVRVVRSIGVSSPRSRASDRS
jgi:phosphoribosylanthranilate isomerase